EGGPRWRRAPVGAIRGEEQLELAVAKLSIEDVAQRERAEPLEAFVLPPPEVIKEAVQVRVANDGEEPIERGRLVRKQFLHGLGVFAKIGRHRKRASVREMEV